MIKRYPSILLFASLFSIFVFFSCYQNFTSPFWEGLPAPPSLQCQSAILIDQHSGKVLFEKNADEKIPPASMTKLFLLYLALEGEKNGKWDMKRTEEVLEEADFHRQPPLSSLMFLETGDLVSMEELLWGLMISSGNDAAVALSQFMYKSVSECVVQMNRVAKESSLKSTFFEEPSGYSPKNVTTARDFARFCSKLWKEFPAGVEKFCSQTSFSYPKAKNKPSWRNSSQPTVFQMNHNELIGRKEGVKGFKTGYISQSGANIALVYTPKESCFIAVLMGGVGEDSMQRSLNRTVDALSLLSWAENHCQTVTIKGPSSLFVLEKKSGKKLPVFSVGERIESFNSDDLARLEYRYKIKKSIQEFPSDSNFPVPVGKWKLILDKQTIASGNLLIKKEK